jgi:hypothetical protein
VTAERDVVNKALRNLTRSGLLLLTDPTLPSLVSLIVGKPIKGSWWGHAKGSLIFNVSNELGDHADVLTVKLVSGKVTFVHKKLWPALYAVGLSHEEWQTRGLPAAGTKLLSVIERKSPVRADRLTDDYRKVLPILERRLLAVCGEIHTESGAHAKTAESWRHWAKRVGMSPIAMSPESAKEILSEATAALAEGTQGRVFLPWVRSR